MKSKGINISNGTAYIKGTRIPVWVVVEARKLGLEDASILTCYPTISQDDLLVAWDYYNIHVDEIELELHENSTN